jgi:hypothetical protein
MDWPQEAQETHKRHSDGLDHVPAEPSAANSLPLLRLLSASSAILLNQVWIPGPIREAIYRRDRKIAENEGIEFLLCVPCVLSRLNLRGFLPIRAAGRHGHA